MAFVPSYKHDIFVSYAHVDNQQFPGTDERWVTTLVKGLKMLLAQNLGRNEAYSLWMDYELSGNVPLTPDIMNALRGSATLLIILSQGYLKSEWCLREKNTFLDTVKERVRSGSRVFIVERGKVSERPSEFADLLGYRFWVEDREGRPPRILGMPKPNPDDLRYYDLLTDLSYDLAKELRRLREAAERLDTETPVPDTSTTPLPTESPPDKIEVDTEAQVSDTSLVIFLAEVTEDLDPLLDDVKRHLNQAGFRVLPDTWYSRDDPTAFQEAVDSDLAKCELFVQLLSGVPGRGRYPRLQYDRAVAMNKTILQWRSPELEMATVTDADHGAFLEGNTDLAVGDLPKRECLRLFSPRT